MSSNRKPRRKPGPTRVLPPEALELVAARFRALGEPMRLRLLSILMEGERSVTELVGASQAGQANVSKHLAVLREANMVAFRKEGTTTIYYIADPLIFELCELMCKRLQQEMAARAAHFD
jgi:DNA-binding transcriptional ArsR family regulator